MTAQNVTRFASYDDGGPDAARGLHHYVVNRLGQRIASGELAVDTKIAPEAVSEELGASRPVVREALRVLEAKGMVRPRPKTGTRVLPMAQWNLLDQDVISWRIMGPDREAQLAELTDLRIAVEIYAARLCAANATAEDIAALHAACDEMAHTATANDYPGFTGGDVAFHTALLNASGNAVFRQFATPFAAYLHAREDLHTLPETMDDSVAEEHRAIVRAIEVRDAHQAEQCARALIERSRDELRRRLDEAAGGGKHTSP